MNDKEKNTEAMPEAVEAEFFLDDDFDDFDVEKLIPSMNVTKDIMPQEPKECIIKDEALVGIYTEILENVREDRKQADELLTNFLDMVLNDGESSSASKEAIVNLMKIKVDQSDKMSKIADLMTRIKLKDKDTFPRYLAAQQNNKVVIEGSKRDLLKSINKIANKDANKKVKPNDA